MRILVDVDGEQFPAEVESTATVADVCGKVPFSAGRRLLLGEQELRNAESLGDLGVRTGSILTAILQPLPDQLRKKLEEICPEIAEEIEEGYDDEFYVNNSGVSGEELAEAVVELLPYTKLRELGLSFNDLGDRAMCELARALTGSRIELLHLHQTGLAAEGLKAVAEYLPRSRVQELRIGGNTAGDEGGVAIAQAVPRCKVEILQMAKSEYGDPVATALSESLKMGCALRDLNLSENNITDVGLCNLASGINAKSALVILKLRKNIFGPQGTKALAEALPESQIQELDISENQLGLEGAEALGKALKNGSPLSDLVVNSCNIPDDGLVAIADALRSSSLQTLKVASNDISDDGAAELSAKLNRWQNEVTEVDLSENNISKAGTIALRRGFPEKVELTI